MTAKKSKAGDPAKLRAKAAKLRKAKAPEQAPELPPYLFNARRPHRPTVDELWRALQEERRRCARVTERYGATLEARLTDALESIDSKLVDVEMAIERR